MKEKDTVFTAKNSAIFKINRIILLFVIYSKENCEYEKNLFGLFSPNDKIEELYC